MSTKTPTKATKPKGIGVKVAGADAAMNKTNGRKHVVTGEDKISSCAPVEASKGAKRSPSSVPAKPRKELTAREATLQAWQTTYANRHKRVA